MHKKDWVTGTPGLHHKQTEEINSLAISSSDK